MVRCCDGGTSRNVPGLDWLAQEAELRGSSGRPGDHGTATVTMRTRPSG